MINKIKCFSRTYGKTEYTISLMLKTAKLQQQQQQPKQQQKQQQL